MPTSAAGITVITSSDIRATARSEARVPIAA